MTKKSLLLALVLYVLAAAGTFGVMTLRARSAASTVAQNTDTNPADATNQLGLLNISPSEPKDQPCPLNGVMYTKTQANAWQKRRPLFVMIENTPDARPQSGLSSADVVFEAVAEGGITRFGAMFYCKVQTADTELAPIRSARTYFIDWASGFNRPMYVHVGGANTSPTGPADALGQLGDYGWNGQNDMNQFSIGYPTFVRDANRLVGRDVATEHTMVTSTEKLWAVAAKRGWTNMSPSTTVKGKVIPGTDWKAGYTGWKFEDGKPVAGGTATAISYDFWTGFQDYSVAWAYDSASNTYKRSEGGAPHMDLNDNQQIAASNVIVLLTTEKGPIDDKKHMLYTTIGTGDALVFKNGEAIKATWSKKDRESELQFLDAKGNPLTLNRGLTWISVVAKNDPIKY